jgi:hypothetical protein
VVVVDNASTDGSAAMVTKARPTINGMPVADDPPGGLIRQSSMTQWPNRQFLTLFFFADRG